MTAEKVGKEKGVGGACVVEEYSVDVKIGPKENLGFKKGGWFGFVVWKE